MSTIEFPSASQVSKLSSNPTSKVPQSTDWVFQDFFNSMLDYHHGIAMPPDVFPNELATHNNNLFFDIYTHKEEDEADAMAPILIESDISSDSASSIDTEQDEPVVTNNNNNGTLTTRKSSSSFRSLRSLFQMSTTNKKQEIILPYHTLPKKTSIRKTLTRKLSKLFRL
jgi:hypothetical protein